MYDGTTVHRALLKKAEELGYILPIDGGYKVMIQYPMDLYHYDRVFISAEEPKKFVWTIGTLGTTISNNDNLLNNLSMWQHAYRCTWNDKLMQLEMEKIGEHGKLMQLEMEKIGEHGKPLRLKRERLMRIVKVKEPNHDRRIVLARVVDCAKDVWGDIDRGPLGESHKLAMEYGVIMLVNRALGVELDQARRLISGESELEFVD